MLIENPKGSPHFKEIKREEMLGTSPGTLPKGLACQISTGRQQALVSYDPLFPKLFALGHIRDHRYYLWAL